MTSSDPKNSNNIFQKLLYSTLSVLVTSTILNYFYARYVSERYLVNVNFHSFASENWTEECHDQITEYLVEWENESLTPDLAICKPECSYDSRNGHKILYDAACRTFPLFLPNEIVDEQNLKDNIPYAEATIPCFMNLSISKIPGANRGIFTRAKLSKGLIFGPYTGVIQSAYGDEGDSARDGGYAWRIYREDENGEEDDFFIDGVNDTESNWMRYVNSARYEEEQNMYVLMFNQSVYYMTYKDVEPNLELLVWYGKSYADYLNITTVEGSDHDWSKDFAPRKDIVLCDSCDRSREDEVFENEIELDKEEIAQNQVGIVENPLETVENPTEAVENPDEAVENPEKIANNPYYESTNATQDGKIIPENSRADVKKDEINESDLEERLQETTISKI